MADVGGHVRQIHDVRGRRAACCRGPAGARHVPQAARVSGGAARTFRPAAQDPEHLRPPPCRQATSITAPGAARPPRRASISGPATAGSWSTAVPWTSTSGRETARMVVRQPLESTDMLDKVDLDIRVSGGGGSGQAGAIRHGITRALINYDEALRKSPCAGPASSPGTHARWNARRSVCTRRASGPSTPSASEAAPRNDEAWVEQRSFVEATGQHATRSLEPSIHETPLQKIWLNCKDRRRSILRTTPWTTTSSSSPSGSSNV